MPKKVKRPYYQGPQVMERGIPCPHCGHLFGHRVTNTYPNGRRRRLCGGCGKPFVAMREQEV